MRRLNDVCVGQSEGCLPLAILHRYSTVHDSLREDWVRSEPSSVQAAVGLYKLNSVYP
jgi:hypothetical protein